MAIFKFVRSAMMKCSTTPSRLRHYAVLLHLKQPNGQAFLGKNTNTYRQRKEAGGNEAKVEETLDRKWEKKENEP